MRTLISALVLMSLVLSSAAAPTSVALTVAANGGSQVSYRAPVPGPLRIVRGFDPPATPYGPGHLGLDLAVSPATAVRTAGPGRVRFAGQVAGRGVVVIEHPDGISTEYEPVLAAVRVGEVVSGRTVVGRVAGDHAGCQPSRCLHWGARSGQNYLDPLSLLAGLGVVRLVPWDWLPGQPLS